MIVFVFVTRSDREDPLGNHLALLVRDSFLASRIGNRVVDRIDQPELGIDLPEQ